MRKFIIHLVYFLLPVIVLAYPIDIVISGLLKKNTAYAVGELSVWNDIFDGRINSDIVICGSSRAWVQIDPFVIADSLKRPTYNLGVDGHNFQLQKLRYDMLIKYNKKPNLVIYSVDIFTLQKRSDLFNMNQFLPYILWNRDIQQVTKNYIGFDIFDYYIPLKRYLGNYEAFFWAAKMARKEAITDTGRVRGYKGQNLKWTSDFEQATRKITSYKVKIDRNAVEGFEQFIKECKRNNIELILVYSPELLEGQKFVSNRCEVMTLFNSLAKKYSIPFLDYSDHPLSYNQKLFYNASHLNRDGAELFSKDLANKLRNTVKPFTE